MGAPSPELVDLWLAKAFNAQDVELAAGFRRPAGFRTRPSRAEHALASAQRAPHLLERQEAGRTWHNTAQRGIRAEPAGAALVAGAGARSAKEASHA